MNSFFQLFSICCLLLTVNAVSAQNNFWEPLNGPNGVVDVQDMASNSSGQLFLAMKDLIYCSLDNGDTWNLCNTGLPTDLNFEKFVQSPSTGFFICPKEYTGVYRFEPGSSSWDFIAFDFGSFEADVFDIDPQGRLWVGLDVYNHIYYSTDTGQTFQQVLLDSNYLDWYDRIATYSDAHNLFAVNGNVYHFSIDGTSQLVISDVNTSNSHLRFHPYTGSAFYVSHGTYKRSTDGGLTWQDMAFLPGQPSTTKVENVIFETNGKIWMLTNHDEIYFSDDDGMTWLSFTSFSETSGDFFKIENAWFNSDCVLQRTYDAGVFWADLTASFETPVVHRIQKDGAGNLYALICDESQYIKSNDEGLTWSPFMFTDSIDIFVKSLATQPNGVVMATGSNNRLYRSIDNGINWENITSIGIQQGLPFQDFRFFSDPNGAFYLFEFMGGVWKTVNNGDAWKVINLSDAEFYSVPGFHPNGDIFIADYSNPKVYIAAEDTTINLEILNQTSFDAELIHCTVKGVAFMSASSPSINGYSLYRILPDGNYVPEPVSFFEGQFYIRDIVSNNAGDVFVALDNLVYRSQDDGNNWTIFASPSDNDLISTIYIAPDQYLYAGYYGDVIHRSTQPTAENNLICGKVWLDADGDCTYDAGEQLLISTAVLATGNGDYTSFSGYNGNFTLTAPAGTYILNVQPPNALYEPCFSDVPVTLDGPNDSAKVDIPLKAVAQCPYLSVNLTTPVLRRCFDVTYTVRYRNDGTATATGAYIDIILDSFFIFQSSSLPVTSQNGFIYSFGVSDLEPGQSGSFSIVLSVSCDAALGQLHCISAHIYPDQLCLPLLRPRAFYYECRQNIGSFDPNDKRAFVGGQEEPGYTQPNTDIEYLIRFQNTGTDTAFRVVLEDRLSTLLDLSSVTPLVSSHSYTFEVRDQRVLRFVFDNILLPDSNINAAASNGFVKFRVSQIPDVPLGYVIKNEADIFFDFNAAVRTNASTIVVSSTIGTRPVPGNSYRVSAFPNPFNERITFGITGPALPGPATLRLFDVLGRQVRQEEFTGETFVLGRTGLQSGLYCFLIESEGRWVGSGKILAK